jgi:ferrous iron transport protein A
MIKEKTTSLCALEIGARCKVLGFHGGFKSYRQKLLAMGLTPGTEFQVKRIAPLGDPIELEVRGFSLSLRKVETSSLILQRMGE